MNKIIRLSILLLSSIVANAQIAIEYGVKTNQREWKFAQDDLRHGAKSNICTHYTMLTGKRRECSNMGKQTIYTITNTTGDTPKSIPFLR